MSVIEGSDIKVYYSGGASNDNPAQSLGGVKSSVIVAENLHDLFGKVGAAEAESGSTKYRAVFIENTHDTLTFESAVAYIKSQTTSPDTTVEIGVCDEGKNESIQTIANETTAPTNVTFTASTDSAQGKVIGDLESGDYIGIWLKRIVSLGAAAYGNDTGELAWKGETTATTN